MTHVARACLVNAHTPLPKCTCAQLADSFLFDIIFDNSLSQRHLSDSPVFRISLQFYFEGEKKNRLPDQDELLTECPT
ncbi:hypothetical protein CEXT_381471 [Caerostris extrusa]|uniref:Uncharacterized protein n=1 Tax=Caerostris extrusa TaxID=172846 RepID=A0AAV4XXD6_CAEEX|nr:hypothetical protein CEXT_381471 [Caerostris extrusa]